MYWRRFPISSIPLDNSKAFDLWLRARWTEKDNLIEGYLRTGRFPADKGVDKAPDGRTRRGAGYIMTEIKPNNWYEFLQVFAPIGMLVLVLYAFYGALPKKYSKSIDRTTLINNLLSMEKNQIEGLDRKKLMALAQNVLGTNLPELQKVVSAQKEKAITLENQDLLKRILSIQKSGIQGPETKQLMDLAQKYLATNANPLGKEVASLTSDAETLDRQTLLNKIVSIQKAGVQGPESKQLMDLAQKYLGSEISGLNELLERNKSTISNNPASNTQAKKPSNTKSVKSTSNQASTPTSKAPSKAPSVISTNYKSPRGAAAKTNTPGKVTKPLQQAKPIPKPHSSKPTKPTPTAPKKPEPKPKITAGASKMAPKPKVSPPKSLPTKASAQPAVKKPPAKK